MHKVNHEYLQRMMCVMQSYIAIMSKFGGGYSFCHNCYFLHAINICEGKHSHQHIHYRRSATCCNTEIKCTLCEANLSQIVTSEVCIICNKGEIQTINNHLINKSNFI